LILAVLLGLLAVLGRVPAALGRGVFPAIYTAVISVLGYLTFSS